MSSVEFFYQYAGSKNVKKRVYPKYSDRQARANFVDPDQTLQNVASDQGLHCLPLLRQFYGIPAGRENGLFSDFRTSYG